MEAMKVLFALDAIQWPDWSNEQYFILVNGERFGPFLTVALARENPKSHLPGAKIVSSSVRGRSNG